MKCLMIVLKYLAIVFFQEDKTLADLESININTKFEWHIWKV